MAKITDDTVVDLVLQLKWESEVTRHTEWYLASRVNMWRDIIPDNLRRALRGKKTGDQISLTVPANQLPWPQEQTSVFKIKHKQFGGHTLRNSHMIPRQGRFYPRGILKDVSGVFQANMEPFRCVGINNGHITVDFNHPLAGRDISLSAVVGLVDGKTVERGGTSVDWLDTIARGAGMQARWQGLETDYFSDDAFRREDETADALFYKNPRLVQHMDDTAIEMVTRTHRRFLNDGMAVLDLMSSWQSHVPEDLNLKRLAGLGLNAEEMDKNPLLTDHVVHNLNDTPPLPFDDNTFDAVLCTVSVEYLTDPVAVFKAVGRALKPGGIFLVSFSNRWFPPKAINLWRELHEFERMGLVTEYFLRAGFFQNVETYSARGMPRPTHDKYYPEFRYADPVYAAWGRKILDAR